MNQYETKAVQLSLAVLDGVERTTDVTVYNIVKCISDAIRHLHFTSVDHRMAIEDAVLTELEKKGVEVCY
jgi:hypothetical protein